jgi:hypothetical protein
VNEHGGIGILVLSSLISCDDDEEEDGFLLLYRCSQDERPRVV